MPDSPAEWVPDFPGQRPPFAPGNEAAVTHGAWSERRVSPVARQILDELLADPATPRYLIEDSSYGPALAAWSRTEAQVQMLMVWIDRHGHAAALAKNGLLLEQLRKWEVTAASQRARLGLDPLSRAKILRDLAATRYMSGPSAFDEALDARQRARELEAGIDGS